MREGDQWDIRWRRPLAVLALFALVTCSANSTLFVHAARQQSVTCAMVLVSAAATARWAPAWRARP